MMSMQTVHQVSDPQPTVEKAMSQLSQMLDETLEGLDTLFKKNGGTMWGVEAISHNVLTVAGESKRGSSVRFVASELFKSNGASVS
ncbi:hypothetical protein [Paeniglutamicibacter antarcticus]|uniref:WXG100 family type VII secretion target n=1 Tax=Paeniglutamicibacter antarcticus TaxID=494023 RepID=A0ABP9TMH2_9MICC